jgi:hypothetical protein
MHNNQNKNKIFVKIMHDNHNKIMHDNNNHNYE